jgi:lipopolysaccharide transport system permease protein
MNQHTNQWDLVIKNKTSLFDLRLKQVWRYRDLLYLFIDRNFKTTYKQTLLGPLWFFIQPILTTVTFTIIFGNIAKIPTDGAPKLIFYMTGITIWSYFSSCLTGVSGVFQANANIFSKVYFPRLIMPLTIVISNLLRFSIQFLLFLCFLYYFYNNGSINPNIWVIYFPIVILLMALLSMGIGLILSSMTTKYRDLSMLIGFGVQLLMYASPIIYPVSEVPEQYLFLIKINPLVPVFEYMRYAFLGIGEFSFLSFSYTFLMTFIFLVIGILIFNKVQKTFMDTV